jgi:hypothetical protein
MPALDLSPHGKLGEQTATFLHGLGFSGVTAWVDMIKAMS